ncbi:MAG: HAMP domain-containing histidine kinase [Actinobacteria bacterium]|nr:HAMP domain-containing histidine kinase [Actinomycetota bacterium]
MSLRLRSVLAAAIATTIAVVVLGSAVDVLVARHLHHELDKTLRTRAVEVAQLAASAPAVLTTPGSLDSPVGATQAMVEVVDHRDRIVARSLSLGGRVLPPGLANRSVTSDTSRYTSLRFGADHLRIYVAPLSTTSGQVAGGAVLVAASTADVDDTIRTLHVLTLLAALAAAAIGAIVVALLMRSALRPLVRLASAAGEISRSGDARRRLPNPGRPDEVGRLASTLNRMLDSLERSRDSERRFLADASHELRTPLTALRGNVAHLARYGPTPELVSDLEADAARLARLADDLLVLSREEAAGPLRQQVRLDELAREIASGSAELESEEVWVEGDPEALGRALSNLLDNAHAYGPAGGRVQVEVARRGDRALLTVEDEGSGPDDADREHAFERFWRARSGGEGSGLGLAIVRATAERHGGTATVVGSRFTIDLPALRKASEITGTLTGENLEKGSS